MSKIFYSVILLGSISLRYGLVINRPDIKKSNDPEQVRIALGKDSKSMSVTWTNMHHFENPSTVPKVNYGVNPYYLTTSVAASTNPFVYKLKTQYIHTSLLTNLKPSTTYYYQVGSNEGWGATFNFTTFPQGSKFSYTAAIYGDLGMEDDYSLPYLKQGAKDGSYDIAFHIGDFAYNLRTHDGKNGDDWFNAVQDIAAYKPYMAIAGNHEEDHGENFTHYRNRFVMPANNPYGDSQFYSINLGPVHFIGLSTEYYEYTENYGQQLAINQQKWLIEDLKQANANRANQPWIIVYQHRPYYCADELTKECQNYVDSLLKDGFDQMPGMEKPYLDYGVDLVFWGHKHGYERFYPIANNVVYKTDNPYHNPKAPVYITTGAAGNKEGRADYTNPTNPAIAKLSTDFGYSFLHVHNATHLHMQQFSADNNGQVIDEVWVTKDVGYTFN